MSKKHVHKLKRHKYKNGEHIYFCVNDCKFKVNTKLALGTTTECWKCKQPFSMNEYSIRLDKPHCPNCTKRKDSANEATPTIPDIATDLLLRLRTSSETIADLLEEDDIL